MVPGDAYARARTWYLDASSTTRGNGRFAVAHEHLSEDRLEQYAMGRLEEFEVAQCEHALLVCEMCRNRLTEVETFLAELKRTLQEHDQSGG